MRCAVDLYLGTQKINPPFFFFAAGPAWLFRFGVDSSLVDDDRGQQVLRTFAVRVREQEDPGAFETDSGVFGGRRQGRLLFVLPRFFW
jgi:hypothetical protein